MAASQTDRRVREIGRRVRARRCRRERHLRSRLGAFVLVLLAGVGALLREAGVAGAVDVTGGTGSVLLRQGAAGYVVVGVAAFVAGVLVAVAGIRLREARRRRYLADDGVTPRDV